MYFIVVLNDNDVENVRFRVRMFNAIFNNISVITWPSVLLVEETGVPSENHRSVVSHGRTLSQNAVLSTPRYERDLNSHI